MMILHILMCFLLPNWMFVGGYVNENAGDWVVQPKHIDITSFDQPFFLTINANGRSIQPEDFFVVEFGPTKQLQIFPRIVPYDYVVNKNENLGDDMLHIRISKTDGRTYFILSFQFPKKTGLTLMVRHGNSANIVFMDTLTLTEEPEFPKIVIVKGDVTNIIAGSSITVQCMTTNLGVPQQQLKLEITGAKDYQIESEQENMVVKTFRLGTESTGQIIRCSIGSKVARYVDAIRVYQLPYAKVKNLRRPNQLTNLKPGDVLVCENSVESNAETESIWYPVDKDESRYDPIILHKDKLFVLKELPRFAKERHLAIIGSFHYACEIRIPLPKALPLTDVAIVGFNITTGLRPYNKSFIQNLLTFILAVLFIGLLILIVFFIFRIATTIPADSRSMIGVNYVPFSSNMSSNLPGLRDTVLNKVSPFLTSLNIKMGTCTSPDEEKPETA